MLEELFNQWTKEDFYKNTVKSTEYGFQLLLAVPGYGKEDFNISLEGNLLTIAAEKFRTQKYELPDNIEDIVAKCDKGILTLDLYKSKKKTKVIKVS